MDDFPDEEPVTFEGFVYLRAPEIGGVFRFPMRAFAVQPVSRERWEMLIETTGPERFIATAESR